MITVFENEEFGSVRTVIEDGRILFCAKDVAKSLGYVNPRKAILDHCRCVTKRDVPHPRLCSEFSVNAQLRVKQCIF